MKVPASVPAPAPAHTTRRRYRTKPYRAPLAHHPGRPPNTVKNLVHRLSTFIAAHRDCVDGVGYGGACRHRIELSVKDVEEIVAGRGE